MYQFPISTYRLQFNAKFTFQDALNIVKYLHNLGISHCYSSPIFRAKPGSLHGYDVLDHSQLNPELGTQTDFEAFSKALKSNQMGMILDIIPNHMYAVDNSNRWWADILENGPTSPYAEFFDIDWHAAGKDPNGKVLLPLLEDLYGNVLEAKQLQVIYREGAFFVEMPGILLPTDPCSWACILGPIIEHLTPLLAPDDSQLLEMQSIATALSHLPLTSETDKEKIQERLREKEIIKQRLNTLVEKEPSIQKIITESLSELNGMQGDLRSFDNLENFLNAQVYRLCFWRVANDEINYRRFFDIISLAGLCTEREEVFEATHSFVFQMVEKKQIDGLRIDHLDGLRNPESYLKNLQSRCTPDWKPEEGKEALFYTVAEKILIGNERLPSEWLVHGTTGYDFLNQVNGLFVVQSNRRAIFDIYGSFTEVILKPMEHIYHAKKLILESSMASELRILSRQLDRISKQHRSSRDFTKASLRTALLNTIAFFPVYRSYIDACAQTIYKEDRDRINTAINRAKKHNPFTSDSIFDFIRTILLLEPPQGLTDEQIAEREEFVMRFQQLTGPVMAKGVEDTAFYRFFPLASLNEVGADFTSFGMSLEAFHEKNRERQETWPHTLLAESTHDTKRSADVRARMNVLSEIPEVWNLTIRRWQEMNQKFKGRDGDDFVPDENDEYLFYQTLVGTWPLYPLDPPGHVHYMNRIQSYMDKALKEAKIHTSWTNPNIAYEQKVKQFIQKVLELDSSVNPFLVDFNEFMSHIVAPGMLNSLSQTVIRTTSPG
ncbi:MAG: malto-oligosyltrehalose synthase, partial [Verrucomicrobia bacterium]|nr:malto-oligosyltrehalose synthase [Verrucomicrobiota bacterium]